MSHDALLTLGWNPKDDPQSSIVQAMRAGVEVDLGGDEGVVHVRNEDEANRLRGALAVLRAQAAGAAKTPAKRATPKSSASGQDA
jgi:hypothetical protein